MLTIATTLCNEMQWNDFSLTFWGEKRGKIIARSTREARVSVEKSNLSFSSLTRLPLHGASFSERKLCFSLALLRLCGFCFGFCGKQDNREDPTSTTLNGSFPWERFRALPCSRTRHECQSIIDSIVLEIYWISTAKCNIELKLIGARVMNK